MVKDSDALDKVVPRSLNWQTILINRNELKEILECLAITDAD
jgi:hypothetical protein